jgi:hypothetical protein
MKKGTAGISALRLGVMILFLSGCTSVQDHRAVAGDPPQIAGALPSEKPAFKPVVPDSDEDAARREAEARENARKQEEVRRLLEDLESTHRQAEAEEARRQGEAQENARKQEEVRRLLEDLELTHRQAEAEEARRQRRLEQQPGETREGTY